MCCRYVSLLMLFSPAAQQNHQPFSIPSEINPVAWTKIQPQLLNARSNAFNCCNIASFQPVKSNSYTCLSGFIQLSKPSLKGIAPQTINVMAYFYHLVMVAQKILLE